VANGAVRHHLYKTVSARISPYCYGVLCDVGYEPSNEEHEFRVCLVYTSATSEKFIGPTFSSVAKKVLVFPSISYILGPSSYRTEIRRIDEAKLTVVLYVYDGEGPIPLWFQENEEEFRKLCDIKADLSEQCTPKSKSIVDGREFWVLRFSVEVTLGSTEIEARIKWQNGGKTKYSPATVVYV